uniref:mitochondrial mRNA pseudouridine synthase Rpusd3-like n=1 Tax=Styela clava TaxID=7725 RepID=UPI00193AA6F8|nr:mitochondrial mRNA pseudouridine synthase Rpusd3-like [Styela clava]
MSMCYSTSAQSTTKTNIPWFKINKLYEKISLSSEDHVKHFLATNFLFENEHFISYNKPAGVHAFCGIERNLEDRTSSVEDIIHLIAHKHDCPDLQICNAPHLDYSGVMLLAKSSAANNAMRKSFKLAKKAEKYLRTDLAITIGVPDPPTDLIKVSIENRKIKEKIVEMPVLNPSITKIKTKAVRLRRSYYEVLDSMKGMSLVKILTS